MTHKRYHYTDDVLGPNDGHDGVELPNGVEVDDAAAELYSRVGARFRVEWQPHSPAEPVIDKGSLPDEVTLSDIENALSAMKSEGKI